MKENNYYGITLLLEDNRIREVEKIPKGLVVTHTGVNNDGIDVRIIDTELNSILPATRLLMPELTSKKVGIIARIMLVVVILVVFGLFFLLFSFVNGSKEQKMEQVPAMTLPAMPNLEQPQVILTGSTETPQLVYTGSTETPQLVLEQQKIDDLRNEYALLDSSLTLSTLQGQYDRLSAILDKVKSELDMCNADREQMKTNYPKSEDVEAGRKLRGYCSDPKRTDDEKAICGRLFFNF